MEDRELVTNIGKGQLCSKTIQSTEKLVCQFYNLPDVDNCDKAPVVQRNFTSAEHIIKVSILQKIGLNSIDGCLVAQLISLPECGKGCICSRCTRIDAYKLMHTVVFKCVRGIIVDLSK